MKILLATDGSEHSEAAVDEIARRHFSPDSEVRVISVVEPLYFALPYPLDGIDTYLYKQSETDSRKQAWTTVENVAAKIRSGREDARLTVSVDVLPGSPKQVILDESEKFGADLIVVGSHGHGMLERFLLGSVSQSVALHATCSVEIVRSPKAPAS